jgi:peptidoglycan/xylan/chitin deacetylase (PgdA/CDA1 family)
MTSIGRRVGCSGSARRSARRTLCCALAVAATVTAADAGAQDSAVILTYQRFAAEPGRLATTLDELDAHLAHLETGGYSVLPLGRLVAALAGGEPLPERTVAITIEGAHDSVHRLGWPRFRKAGVPVTVLVTTGMVDAGEAGRMSWGELRELASAGAAIGTHGAFYRSQVGRAHAAVAADVTRARGRIIDELGAPPELFAYPYGLHDADVRAAVAEAGFIAALGQQSGAAHRGSNLYALPRFSVFGRFAALDRFQVVAEVLPLRVQELVPSEPVVEANPPDIGFTLAEGQEADGRLSCYASGLGMVPLIRLGARRIELSLGGPLPAGRDRVNCTLPGPEGRWRWLGLQLLVPAPEPR